MLPTRELRDHVTAVLDVPMTAAENCCVWPASSVELEGLTETEMPRAPEIGKIATANRTTKSVSAESLVIRPQNLNFISMYSSTGSHRLRVAIYKLRTALP